ncbi:hypothetical protein L1987_42672 [Smallanthus sonchifolius]|uniref:Uncharacterized protein n=1 Tax=Smallanthus sonchifolius TaxID=185202 RepID=A0ACB9GKK8_9ASTR|nr:hypothetical protein L1987_42672 [Smallanthus sonchifolius]
METLEEHSTINNDRLAQKAKISFPNEIVEEIISRLPVKSILRFRSVCKPWLSLISDPSFAKLQLTRATHSHRTALFISAYDPSTRKRHFLSAAHDGGSVTHLFTLANNPTRCDITEAEHLNGLVLFNYGNDYIYQNYAFVVNPSTHKIFKLPDLTNYAKGKVNICYFFGFDESRNEHKVLSIASYDAQSIKPKHQIMVFSFSNYSWRKIDVDLPSDCRWYNGIKRSVCVNSVIHLILQNQKEILAFDLRLEKFLIVKIPPDAQNRARCSRPHLMKINGLLGVVRHDGMFETNEMHMWTLQDYENRVWVKQTVTFPKSWSVVGCPFPLDSANMEEIIFSLNKLSRNVISALIYNMKSGCFKSVQFNLDHPFLCSDTVQFQQIKCYVERIMPF